MEELGSGFYLAMHDLEIRGAGEDPGEEQSGEMQEIEVLALRPHARARCLKIEGRQGARSWRSTVDVLQVNLHVPALLPRPTAATCTNGFPLAPRRRREREQLDALREELVDRFGELPEPARADRVSHGAHRRAAARRVARVATRDGQLQFIKNPPLDGAKVIDFIRKKGRHARLAGEKLRVDAKLPEWQARRRGEEILQQLAA